MAALPVVSGLDAIRTFERAGWRRARQKGSHVSLVKPGVNVNLSVPLHRELDRGTLRRLSSSRDSPWMISLGFCDNGPAPFEKDAGYTERHKS
ncbi:MAG TPA: type II toxin-antitoxin system HicA family toxin [Terriglobia bacterium]|nr:type II toxin-antitoxin system HicA family toxin [Terriglobia bacterium]